MNLKTCFVYVAAIDELGFSKVGISQNPIARIAQLATGSPFKVELAAAFATPSYNIAKHLEDGFHSTHKDVRLNGEWFRIEPTDAVLLLIQILVVFFHRVAKVPPEQADSFLTAAGVPRDMWDFVEFCRAHVDAPSPSQ